MIINYLKTRSALLFLVLCFTFLPNILMAQPPVITDFAVDTGIPDGITSDDTITLTGFGLPASTLEIFDGITSLTNTVTVDGSGDWSYTTDSLAEGLHSFTADDGFFPSFPLDIIIDFTNPAAPSITGFTDDTGLPGDDLTSDTDLILVGTAEMFSIVEVFDGAFSLGTTVADPFGAWARATGALTEATHNFTATATDGAGNTGLASGILAITIDTTPPAAPAITAIDDDIGDVIGGITTDQTLNLTGTAPLSTIVEVFAGASSLTNTVTVDGAGNWTYTTNALANAVYSFTAKAIDAAGNPSAASAGKSVTIQSAAPAPTPTPAPQPAITLQSSNTSSTVANIIVSAGSDVSATASLSNPQRTINIGGIQLSDSTWLISFPLKFGETADVDIFFNSFAFSSSVLSTTVINPVKFTEVTKKELSTLKPSTVGSFSRNDFLDISPMEMKSLDDCEYSLILTSLADQAITPNDIIEYLKEGWGIDETTGEIFAPENAELCLGGFENEFTDFYPPDISKSLSVGGGGLVSTIQECIDQTLADTDFGNFSLIQHFDGSVSLLNPTGRVLGDYFPGPLIKVSAGAKPGLSQNSKGNPVITCKAGFAVTFIPFADGGDLFTTITRKNGDTLFITPDGKNLPGTLSALPYKCDLEDGITAANDSAILSKGGMCQKFRPSETIVDLSAACPAGEEKVANKCFPTSTFSISGTITTWTADDQVTVSASIEGSEIKSVALTIDGDNKGKPVKFEFPNLPTNTYTLKVTGSDPNKSISSSVTKDNASGIELTLGEQPVTTAITALTIEPSSLLANSNSTMSVKFKPTSALVAADTITVKLTGYTFAPGAVSVTAGIGITGTLTGKVTDGAVDTLVISGGIVTAGADIEFTFPATNPAAGTIAKAGLTVNTSKDTAPVNARADIVITAPTAVSGVTISPESTIANIRTTMTVQLTATTALVAADSITVKLSGYKFNTGAVTITAGTGLTGTITGSVVLGAQDTLVITGGVVAAGTTFRFTFPVTNPAAGTIAKAGLTVKTSKDVNPVASANDIVVTNPEPATSSLRFTIGPPGDVTVDQPFSVQVTAVDPLGNVVTSQSGNVTIALRKTVGVIAAVLSGSTTVSFTNGVATFSDLRISAADTNLYLNATSGLFSTSSLGTFSSAADTAVSDVTISAGPLTSGSPTTIKVQARYTTALVAVDKITVNLGGYTVTGSSIAVTAGTGITGTLTGAVVNGAVEITGAVVAAGTNATFTFAGLTNPAAGTIAKAGLTVNTTRDKAPVASNADIVITAGIAVTAVTLSASPLLANSNSTMSVELTPTSALVAADTITVKLTGYTFAPGAVSVTAGTGITGTLTGKVTAGAVDTLVISGGIVIPGAAVRFTFPATNPAAGTIAKAGLTVSTSKDTTPVASNADIVITAATAVSDVTFSASPLITGLASTMTVKFRAKTALVGGDTITVDLTGYNLPTVAPKVTDGSGLTGASGSYGTTFLVPRGRLVYTLGTGVNNVAGEMVEFSFPVTNPGVGTVAKAGLTVKTSKDTIPVASSEDIVIAPKSMSFTGSYSTTVAVGKSFASQPQVTFYSAPGVIDTSVTQTVGLSVKTGPVNGKLTGTTSVAAVAGVATFTGLAVDTAGDYVLTASSTGSTSIDTNSIKAVPAGSVRTTKLVFVNQPPATMEAGDVFSLRVEAQDSSGTVNPDESGLVVVSSTGFAVSSVLPFVGGVATFTGLKFNAISSTGFTVTATSGPLKVDTVSKTRVTPITKFYLGFQKYPSNVATAAVFTTEVNVFDLSCSVRTDVAGSVTFTLKKTGSTTTSVLSDGSGGNPGEIVRTMSAGIARAIDARVTGADTGLRLVAKFGAAEGSNISIPSVESPEFIVFPTVAGAASAQATEQTQSINYDDYNSQIPEQCRSSFGL